MKHNPILPTDSAARKEAPICTGVLRYFPRAAAYVARVSVLGNEKHNPGEPLHWAEGKSMDHPDCIVRHAIEAEEFDPDDGALHAGKLAWRAWANLETVLKKRERDGLPIWDEEIIAANRAKQKAALEADPEERVSDLPAHERDQDPSEDTVNDGGRWLYNYMAEHQPEELKRIQAEHEMAKLAVKSLRESSKTTVLPPKTPDTHTLDLKPTWPIEEGEAPSDRPD